MRHDEALDPVGKRELKRARGGYNSIPERMDASDKRISTISPFSAEDKDGIISKVIAGVKVDMGLLTKVTGRQFYKNADTYVIKNLYIEGYLDFQNVNKAIVVNCFIDAEGYSYGITAQADALGVEAHNCEIINASSAGMLVSENGLARRVYIHDCKADGIKMRSGATVDECLIECYSYKEGAHVDGIQIGTGSGMRIKNTTIKTGLGAGFNACLFIHGDTSIVDDVIVENCFFSGSIYTVRLRDDNYALTNVIFRDNYIDDVTYQGEDNYSAPALVDLTGVTWTNVKDYYTKQDIAAA